MPGYVPPPPERAALRAYMREYREVFERFQRTILSGQRVLPRISQIRPDLLDYASHIIVICQFTIRCAIGAYNVLNQILYFESRGQQIPEDCLETAVFLAIMYKEACSITWREFCNVCAVMARSQFH